MADPNQAHHESNRAFYDRIAGAYDLLSDASERQARLTGIDALDLKPGELVLELGCGTGNDLLTLASRAGPAGRVFGVDISPGMLDVTRAKLDKNPLSAPVELKEGDARALPYPDRSFDVVYSSFTLELFPADDLPIVLGEVRRVLRHPGRIGIVSMAKVKPGDKASFLENTYIWCHRHFPHIVDCRPIDADALLKSNGFKVARKKDLELWTMPVAALVAVPAS
jgi:demethylmenaquinone methyltransferase/2-methoxy-6-polyprenyl-1,4-benzoquinol methylase